MVRVTPVISLLPLLAVSPDARSAERNLLISPVVHQRKKMRMSRKSQKRKRRMSQKSSHCIDEDIQSSDGDDKGIVWRDFYLMEVQMRNP
jgi:hypothetical protein